MPRLPPGKITRVHFSWPNACSVVENRCREFDHWESCKLGYVTLGLLEFSLGCDKITCAAGQISLGIFV